MIKNIHMKRICGYEKQLWETNSESQFVIYLALSTNSAKAPNRNSWVVLKNNKKRSHQQINAPGKKKYDTDVWRTIAACSNLACEISVCWPIQSQLSRNLRIYNDKRSQKRGTTEVNVIVEKLSAWTDARNKYVIHAFKLWRNWVGRGKTPSVIIKYWSREVKHVREGL